MHPTNSRNPQKNDAPTICEGQERNNECIVEESTTYNSTIINSSTIHKWTTNDTQTIDKSTIDNTPIVDELNQHKNNGSLQKIGHGRENEWNTFSKLQDTFFVVT